MSGWMEPDWSAGDDGPAPVARRPSVERARDAQTAAEALRLVATHLTSLSGRYACIDEVPRGHRDTAGHPPRQGPLRPRLDARRGEDILSSYLACDVYLRLVHRLGWIAEDFQ
jgi:hypothetical protein